MRSQGAGRSSYEAGYEGQSAGRSLYEAEYEGQSAGRSSYEAEYEGQSSRRNPYLADYEEQRSRRMNRGQEIRRGQAAANGTRRSVEVPIPMRAPDNTERSGRRTVGQTGASNRPPAGRMEVSNRRPGGQMEMSNRRPAGQTQASNRRPVGQTGALNRRPAGQGEAPSRRPSAQADRTMDMRRSARVRRRQRIFMQRLVVGLWVLCVFLLSMILLVRSRQRTPESGNPNGASNAVQNDADTNKVHSQGDEILVQGLPAVEFAKHPEWTEDFLTPNEYSRPGDPLESVKNIFVHYTANPGTSAAQNRSYFERQKDEHQNSVSAHFIIGYEGEIIQCVPLDEVAYAVKSRNYDSISIECCHLAKDGSYTQETYDSLISLLAWLIDVYDLESEDILRHYDCGGKKCPLYYVEHEDAWEKLLADVERYKPEKTEEAE